MAGGPPPRRKKRPPSCNLTLYRTTRIKASWRCGGSLSQVTRRAHNRFPRQQPAPAPNSEPTAIALTLSSQCPPADSPTHTPATPPRPNPTLSFPGAPKKPSLSCAARALALPPKRPTGAQPLAHVCAVSPHRCGPIPQSRHPLLQYAYIRATLAQARDRPRGPESLPPVGIMPQASVGASLVGAQCQRRHGRSARRPLSCSATRRDTCAQNSPAGHYRIGQDRRHAQLRTQQNVAELSRFRLPLFAGATALGAHGNLKRAHGKFMFPRQLCDSVERVVRRLLGRMPTEAHASDGGFRQFEQEMYEQLR